MALTARKVQYPGRVLLTSATDGEGNPIENTYDMKRAEGIVYNEGTPVNPSSINAAIEEAVEEAVQSAMAASTGSINYSVGWGAYSGQTPRLVKSGASVSFSGAFAFSGTEFTSDAAGVTVCTIPAGYRPPAQVSVVCQGSGTNLWLLRVNTNGNVTMSRYRNAAGTYQQVSSSSWFPFSASWIVS